jgi:hypothetical protein
MRLRDGQSVGYLCKLFACHVRSLYGVLSLARLRTLSGRDYIRDRSITESDADYCFRIFRSGLYVMFHPKFNAMERWPVHHSTT